jgi:hypothetical protein
VPTPCHLLNKNTWCLTEVLPGDMNYNEFKCLEKCENQKQIILTTQKMRSSIILKNLGLNCKFRGKVTQNNDKFIQKCWYF